MGTLPHWKSVSEEIYIHNDSSHSLKSDGTVNKAIVKCGLLLQTVKPAMNNHQLNFWEWMLRMSRLVPRRTKMNSPSSKRSLMQPLPEGIPAIQNKLFANNEDMGGLELVEII